jgi:inulin fructotransferase (DFA-I-forming)
VTIVANVYDVTTWTIAGSPGVTAVTDIGAIINSIIADIKIQQPTQASKPGAVIYIPPGDYSLKTRVVIDISYLQIKGSGHGFTSSSIRFNSGNTSSWHEIWPGGSRVRVENTDGNNQAFLVTRNGNPRLSSVEFLDFCIDGVHFTPDENSYTNGKVGIEVATDQDSFRIRGMGLVYLERGIVIRNADALSITGNFLMENGNCIELTNSGQGSSVTNNIIGAGYKGFSIFAENHWGLLISGNNLIPRGKSMVHFKNCFRSTITANRMHSSWPGMVVMEGACDHNQISANHFLRIPEYYSVFAGVNNGQDDLYGLIHVRGTGNTISANHFSYDVPTGSVTPPGAVPTIILLWSGADNYIAANNAVANQAINVVCVVSAGPRNKILDSGTATQFLSYTSSANYSFRATP